MAKVFLICGKLCCGKSVYAERIRMEHKAVILSVDEIMLSIFGPYTGEKHDAYTERVQAYLFEKSLSIVEVGTDMILDWGFWTREKRTRAREFYKNNHVKCELHYINVSDEVWRERVKRRNASVSAGDTTAYYVDRNLAEKCIALFEPPETGEVDVWIDESHPVF